MSAARKTAGRNPDHIKHLVPDPENARKHNPKNIGVIVDSLHAVGAARSIVIDENNTILAVTLERFETATGVQPKLVK